jgi:hypothetical protein
MELDDDGDPLVAAVASLIGCAIAAAESVTLADIDAAREAVGWARAAVVTATYLTASMVGDPTTVRAGRRPRVPHPLRPSDATALGSLATRTDRG